MLYYNYKAFNKKPSNIKSLFREFMDGANELKIYTKSPSLVELTPPALETALKI